MIQLVTPSSPESLRRELREQFVRQWKGKIGADIEPKDAVQILHDSGLSIVESSWVFTQVTDLGLAAIKQLVTSQPCWEKLVRAWEPIHDELEKALVEGDVPSEPDEQNGTAKPVIHGLVLPPRP